ncbi:MAG: FkbM family methyltransferase [Rhodospirillales bacterium]
MSKWHLYQRARSLLERIEWIAAFAGGRLAALALLIRIKRDPVGMHQATYNRRPVLFRASDEGALKLVLVDMEYGFLAPFLGAAAAPRILDLGGHIGTFGAWCGSLAPDAEILSVEADPGTFAVLEANAATWRKDGFNWRTKHGAAWDRDGESLLLDIGGATMSHHVSNQGKVAVPSLSLPTLVELVAADGGMIDLLKVDIEGSEERLICSAPAALDRIKNLVIELHPAMCDADRVHEMLRQRYAAVEAIRSGPSMKSILFCHDA